MSLGTRRALVAVGAYIVGRLSASLPHTTAGWICLYCMSFFVGMAARRLLDRWS